MSKYTTEVRYICEQYAGYDESQGYDKIDEIIHNSHNRIMGNYPIFDENYRETLNRKILKHYYTREICAETVGLWKLLLNNRMNEIMPYYNQLYKSELLKFNPLYDVDLVTTHTRDEDSKGNNRSDFTETRSNENSTINDGERKGKQTVNSEDNKSGSGIVSTNGKANTQSENENTANSTVENENDRTANKNHTDRYSDTPQGGMNGMQSIEDNLYLTNARIIGENETEHNEGSQTTNASGNTTYTENKASEDNTVSQNTEQNKSEGTTETNETTKSASIENGSSTNESTKVDENNFSTTEAYLEHVRGKRGGTTYAKALMEFRESFLNIDQEIISKLSDLFFGLW